MGISTILIGLLPTYAQIGFAAPVLLSLCRIGQGIGLGGEWGGSVLLAVENAPRGMQAWYGMFPQLGTPVGFMLANGSFLVLSAQLSSDDFLEWGWRIPFLCSAILVIVGMWMRLKLSETPAFIQAVERRERLRVPLAAVLKNHLRVLIAGILTAVTTFVLFYLMTVFTLTWGTGRLGIDRADFLRVELIAICVLAATIPLSAFLSLRYGTLRVIMIATAMTFVFGFAFEPLFSDATQVGVFLMLGQLLMGLTFGSLGTRLAQLFPTSVRYTGASLAFNLAGIVGASVAPYAAVWLASRYGMASVGYYLSGAALLSLIGLWLSREADC
jgi:MFS family permease